MKKNLSKIIASLLVLLVSCGIGQPIMALEANETDDLEKPPSMMTSVVDVQMPSEAIELLPIGTMESIPLPLKNSPIKALEYKIAEPLLDLELPFKVSDSLVQEVLRPSSVTDIFTQNKQKKSQAIRLDGTVLMTDEQETEKRKSLDGAGIAINIKP